MGESDRARDRERGTGLLSATVAVGVIAALLGLAADIAIGLWARSTVDAVAYDTARSVATAPPERDPRRAAAVALARAEDVLGPTAATTRMRFERLGDPDVVRLSVRSEAVSLLPRMVGGGAIVGGLDRTIVMQRERP